MYGDKIKFLMDKQKETYDKELKTIKEDIRNIIKPIELGNVIKRKCGLCP